jgi:hypothetical protein
MRLNRLHHYVEVRKNWGDFEELFFRMLSEVFAAASELGIIIVKKEKEFQIYKKLECPSRPVGIYPRC